MPVQFVAAAQPFDRRLEAEMLVTLWP